MLEHRNEGSVKQEDFVLRMADNKLDLLLEKAWVDRMADGSLAARVAQTLVDVHAGASARAELESRQALADWCAAGRVQQTLAVGEAGGRVARVLAVGPQVGLGADAASTLAEAVSGAVAVQSAEPELD